MPITAQEEAQIRRIIELEVRARGVAQASSQFTNLNQQAGQTPLVFRKVEEAANVANRALSQMAGMANRIGGLFSASDLGLASFMRLLRELSSDTLRLSSAWNKYGVGIRQVETAVERMSGKLSITRIETMRLLTAYERGFNLASLKGAEQLFNNLKKAVGNNVEAMQEMQDMLAGIQARFPDLQRGIERLNESDRRRLTFQNQLLVLTGKLDLSQAKAFQNYLNSNRQARGEDDKRKKLLEDQLEFYGRMRKLFEDISKTFLAKMKPMLDSMAEFIKNHGTDIVAFVDKWGAWIVKIGMLASAVLGVAAAFGTLKMAVNSMGLGGAATTRAAAAAANAARGVVGGGLLGAGGIGAAGAAVGAGGAGGGGAVVAPGLLSRATNTVFGRVTGPQGFQGGIVGSARALGGMAAVGLGSYQAGRFGYDLGEMGAEKVGMNKTTGGVLGAAGTGVLAGAAIGSVIPVVGTALGALIGGAAGLTAAFFKHKEEIDKLSEEQARHTAEMKARAQGGDDFEKGIDEENKRRRETEQKRLADEKARAQRQSRWQSDYYTKITGAGGGYGAITSATAEIERDKANIPAQYSESALAKADAELAALDERLDVVQKKMSEITGDDAAAQGQREKAAKMLKEISDQRAAKEKEVNTIIDNRRDVEDKEVSLQGAMLAYANELKINLQAQSEYMAAMVDKSQAIAENMSASGKVNFETLGKGMDEALAAMDAERQARRENLSFADDRLKAMAAQNARTFKNELAGVGVAPGETMDDKRAREVAKSLMQQSTKAFGAGDEGKGEKLRDAAEAINVFGASARAYMTDIQKMAAEDLRYASKRVDVQINGINAAMKEQLSIAGNLTRAAELDIQLADTMGAGLAASVDMRMKAVDNIEREIQLNETMLEEYQKRFEIERAAGNLEGAAKYRDAILAKENEITQQKIKQLEITKQLREGYISAISAMVAGTGMFAKIMIDQNKNLGMGVKMGAVLQGLRSGGNVAGGGASGWLGSMQYGVGGVGAIRGRNRAGQQQEMWNGTPAAVLGHISDLGDRARRHLDQVRAGGFSMAAQGAEAVGAGRVLEGSMKGAKYGEINGVRPPSVAPGNGLNGANDNSGIRRRPTTEPTAMNDPLIKLTDESVEVQKDILDAIRANNPYAMNGVRTAAGGTYYRSARQNGHMIAGDYSEGDRHIMYDTNGKPAIRVAGGEAVLNDSQLRQMSNMIGIPHGTLVAHLQNKSLAMLNNNLPGMADGGKVKKPRSWNFFGERADEDGYAVEASADMAALAFGVQNDVRLNRRRRKRDARIELGSFADSEGNRYMDPRALKGFASGGMVTAEELTNAEASVKKLEKLMQKTEKSPTKWRLGSDLMWHSVKGKQKDFAFWGAERGNTVSIARSNYAIASDHYEKLHQQYQHQEAIKQEAAMAIKNGTDIVSRTRRAGSAIGNLARSGWGTLKQISNRQQEIAHQKAQQEMWQHVIGYASEKGQRLFDPTAADLQKERMAKIRTDYQDSHQKIADLSAQYHAGDLDVHSYNAQKQAILKQHDDMVASTKAEQAGRHTGEVSTALQYLFGQQKGSITVDGAAYQRPARGITVDGVAYKSKPEGPNAFDTWKANRKGPSELDIYNQWQAKNAKNAYVGDAVTPVASAGWGAMIPRFRNGGTVPDGLYDRQRSMLSSMGIDTRGEALIAATSGERVTSRQDSASGGSGVTVNVGGVQVTVSGGKADNEAIIKATMEQVEKKMRSVLTAGGLQTSTSRVY